MNRKNLLHVMLCTALPVLAISAQAAGIEPVISAKSHIGVVVANGVQEYTDSMTAGTVLQGCHSLRAVHPEQQNVRAELDLCGNGGSRQFDIKFRTVSGMPGWGASTNRLPPDQPAQSTVVEAAWTFPAIQVPYPVTLSFADDLTNGNDCFIALDTNDDGQTDWFSDGDPRNDAPIHFTVAARQAKMMTLYMKAAAAANTDSCFGHLKLTATPEVYRVSGRALGVDPRTLTRVALHNSTGQIVWETQALNGHFSFPDVPSGSYNVEVRGGRGEAYCAKAKTRVWSSDVDVGDLRLSYCGNPDS